MAQFFFPLHFSPPIVTSLFRDSSDVFFSSCPMFAAARHLLLPKGVVKAAQGPSGDGPPLDFPPSSWPRVLGWPRAEEPVTPLCRNERPNHTFTSGFFSSAKALRSECRPV